MVIIKYELEYGSNRCITKCRYSDSGNFVGSYNCKMCTYNKEMNEDEKWVSCEKKRRLEEVTREIEIYRESVPENYTHTFSIVIKSKDSEVNKIEYDLVSALYDIVKDGIKEHTHLKDVKIIDKRGCSDL